MRGLRPWGFAWLVTCGTACSFLLDFDKLQSGGGAGGTSGSDASAGEGTGAAGASAEAGVVQDAAIFCPEGCDDHDPCTDDRCDNGQCVSESASRIVEDGFKQTVSANSIFRSALVAGFDRFYLAAYGDFAEGQNISFYDIPADGNTWTPGPNALQLADFGNDAIISPPALVFDDAADSLIAYFAVGPSTPANFFNAGRVQRAVLSADLQTASASAVSADENYRYILNTLGPAAAKIPGGETFVTWPGAPPAAGALGAGLYFQSGSVPLTAGTLPQILEASDLRGLAAIYGLGNADGLGEPGAVWISQRTGADQVDTHLQLLGGLRQTFGQCANTGVAGISVSTSRAHVDGFWFASWTKQLTEEFVTELSAVVCVSPLVCAFAPACGNAQVQLPTIRNPKVVTYHRMSDPTTVAHQAYAASVVNTDAASTSIELFVQRIALDNSDAGSTAEDVGTLQLAQASTANGPNWPEVAVIAPDKLAVSWVEYGASSDTLNVARYRVCYGD